MNRSTFQRIATALEWPVAILALLIVPALVLQDRTTDPHIRQITNLTNWVIWLAFCFEFVVRWVARGSAKFLREAWFDLVLIVISPPFLVPDYLQGARSLRVLRVIRLARLVRAGAIAAIGLRLARRVFGRRKFHYTALVAIAVVVLGALGIFLFENQSNKTIGTFGDALWWAVVTATTVGYGDVSPVTVEGRVIAVVLMLTGIGVIGVFTATIASLFFEQESESETARIHARLDAIERKLDELLAQSRVR